MPFRQHSVNSMLRQVGILFVLIGIIFAVVSSAGMYWQARQRESLIKTTAVVTEVSRNKTEVTYAADGEYYTVWLNYHSSMKFPGDTMTVYYDPEHPEDAGLYMPWFYAATLIPGILILFPLGTGMLIFSSCRRKRARRLKENGQCVYAEIIQVERDWRFRINRRYASRLVCRYPEPDGTVSQFTSEAFYS